MSNKLRIEINLNQVLDNIKYIQEVSNKNLIPVIKSGAYNLGVKELMKLIDNLNIEYAAVVDTREALELLNDNENYRILILNSLESKDYIHLNNYPNLAISINSLEDYNNLCNIKTNRKIKVHIQVDTGMNRLGFKNIDEYKFLINNLIKNDNVIIEGLYTHFSSLNNALNQIDVFKKYSDIYDFKMIHLASSSTYQNIDVGNYVRVGLDVYGSTKEMQSIKVVSSPISINKVKKGESIGYDEKYIATKDIKVAVLPIGYANGFRRSLTGFKLKSKNKLYSVIGKVCMNHIFVEVDDDISIDSEFIITSNDYPIEIMASFLDTVPHEILCMLNISNRIYIGDKHDL